MASKNRFLICNIFGHDTRESRLLRSLSIPSRFYIHVHYNQLLRSLTGINHLRFLVDRSMISSPDESIRASAFCNAIVTALPFADTRFITEVIHAASSFAFRMVSNRRNRNKTVLHMSLFVNLMDRELLDRGFRQSMGFKPASKACIDGLEKVKFEDCEEVEDCMICMDKYSTVEEVVRLPCKHAFHGDCILQWLKTSHLCPLCRFALPTHA